MIVAAPTLLLIGEVVYPLGTYLFKEVATNLAASMSNYILSMSVWWREVLSQITTILVQTL
ncbi:hypothetical protein KTC96_23820 (plasmid) [Clostridium estertheticum]|uniref:hypothetical protein n=1 Tax=Clostridium estertheticum TaxID=238834 RepID=UPI001C7DA2A2|nr:hypothetical protein [Clostridium estertheticum]MBX4262198.1 hypothetical protein [Clostridium estertheticum]WLC73163.1 hypothetical protein KTC96_23820 [Clostridium estertheticum]